MTTRPTAVERLLEYVAGGVPDHDIFEELRRWLTESRRFRAFAEAHRDKMRRKLRDSTDVAALADVRAEIAVAHRLASDPHIELAWEAAGSQRGGPDFGVTYRRTERLQLEVTRVRRGINATTVEATLLVKLHQLPAGTANLLVLAAAPEVAPGDATVVPIEEAVQSLRARADAKDEALLTTRRFRDTRGFYDRFLRLGGVVAWVEAREGGGTAELWRNRSARIAPPDRASRAIVVALRI
jgi:hypothetical protein